jgi:hypothetical protein
MDLVMANKHKPTKKKARKAPCTKCAGFSVTPSRNASGQFKKTGRAKRGKR